jgi:predicted transposase YdaD
VRESVVYQEIIERGKREEALSFTLRLLTRRIGEVAPDLQAQIQNLPTFQLEELGLALLDFSSPDDLTAWLQNQS